MGAADASPEGFWDSAWSAFEPREFSADAIRAWAAESALPYHRFLSLIGDVRGLDVLDIGCGNGFLSVLLAQEGANVVAVDASSQAAQNARQLAAANGVADTLEVIELDARQLERLGHSFDVVTGTYVLHHIEPFEAFAGTLASVVKPGGRGVFYENSARNRLVMLCREKLAGRFGIPRFGDQEEQPLAPAEIAVLARFFDDVVIHYPNFVFLAMVPTYLFGGNQALCDLAFKADEAIYRAVPQLRKYSYHQIVEVHRGREVRS
jgi:ubiquinone/menaquinone biosynthesis C-methylase UbiE